MAGVNTARFDGHRWLLRARLASFPLILFVLNAWICSRLFHTEYFRQLASVEGEFIALERYIRHHWPWWDWFPMGWGGLPFSRTYPPGLHYLVAILSATTGASIPLVYHFLTGVAYSLGAVAFYWLASVLLESRPAAFCGALLFSLFSPSTLIFREIRLDAQGIWNARRLQALVMYGEGPNITGLMLAMLALGMVHVTLRKRTAASACLAALAAASVAATSWPATMTMLLGLSAYVLALEWREFVAGFRRLTAIAAISYGLASVTAPPSTVFGTLAQADALNPSSARTRNWWMAMLLLASMAAVRWVMGSTLGRSKAPRAKVPLALRFAVLYLLATCAVVIFDLFPQAIRFHLTIEIALILAIAALAKMSMERWPGLRAPAAVLLAVCCVVQAVNYRRFANGMLQEIEIGNTLEYQVAQWCDRNLRGERILASGSVMLWLNAFNETPQMKGLFAHSLSNPQNLSYGYMVTRAGASAEEAAGASLLWMKAWAVRAVSIGGPQSREPYKDFIFPYRFWQKLPMAWSLGDDYIYLVPKRTPGLARVVREGDLVQRPPVHGLDTGELRTFVAALDDATLPMATLEWQGLNQARIHGSLAPDQVYAISINWDRGWTARVNGQRVPLRADGLGLIVIAPRCSGPCELELRWSAAPESRVVTAIFVLTLLGCGFWIWREATASAHKTPASNAGNTLDSPPAWRASPRSSDRV